MGLGSCAPPGAILNSPPAGTGLGLDPGFAVHGTLAASPGASPAEANFVGAALNADGGLLAPAVRLANGTNKITLSEWDVDGVTSLGYPERTLTGVDIAAVHGFASSDAGSFVGGELVPPGTGTGTGAGGGVGMTSVTAATSPWGFVARVQGGAFSHAWGSGGDHARFQGTGWTQYRSVALAADAGSVYALGEARLFAGGTDPCVTKLGAFSGVPDDDFGTHGTACFTTTESERVRDIALLDSGDLLVLGEVPGDNRVAKLRVWKIKAEDGRLDTTFAGSGTLDYALPDGESARISAGGGLLGGSGRFYIFGGTQAGGDASPGVRLPLVLCFADSGSPCAGFGEKGRLVFTERDPAANLSVERGTIMGDGSLLGVGAWKSESSASYEGIAWLRVPNPESAKVASADVVAGKLRVEGVAGALLGVLPQGNKILVVSPNRIFRIKE
jgi:hypothetical protein